jgi:hypothetical protein
MAAAVLWRISKKKAKGGVGHIKHWLKALVSLVVIMGLTWLFGVLIVELEELAFLAYIYSFMVAFQGVWIFLLFVILDQQVREGYSKWWKLKVKKAGILNSVHTKNTTSTEITVSVPPPHMIITVPDS